MKFLARLLLRFIPGASTALTWLRAFKVECLYLALAAALAGVLLGGWGGYKAGRFLSRGDVAEAREDAAVARKDLAKFETSLADLRAENLQLAQDLANKITEKRNEDRNAIDAVAADVHQLGQRLQLCATKSDVRVSVTPGGTIEAVPGGQLRDLAEAVRDFAEACAHQRDRDALDHNALIDWMEGLRRGKRE